MEAGFFKPVKEGGKKIGIERTFKTGKKTALPGRQKFYDEKKRRKSQREKTEKAKTERKQS